MIRIILIQLIVFFLGIFIILTLFPLSVLARVIPVSLGQKEISQSADSGITLTVTYDNYHYQPELQTAWGFSCIIQGMDKTILFDTGGNGQVLLSNMQDLNINPETIDIIVLSHIHGDHVGGLMSFLERNTRSTVYLPQTFPQRFKGEVCQSGADIIEVGPSTEICPNVYSTGIMGSGIKEQSIILRTDQGMIVITGCAHPGIVNILKKAGQLFSDEIVLAMGGFHLGGQSSYQLRNLIADFKRLGVSYVGPCHCSGDLTRQLFEEEYQDHYLAIGVGKVIHLPDLEK